MEVSDFVDFIRKNNNHVSIITHVHRFYCILLLTSFILKSIHFSVIAKKKVQYLYVTTLRSTCSPAGGGVLPGERGRSHTPVTCSSLNYGEDKTLDSNTPLHFVQGIDSLWRSHFFREPLFVYSPYQTFLLPIWMLIFPFDFEP